MSQVSQTRVIFFGLLIGFIVFITVRGELTAYLAVLGLAKADSYAGLTTQQLKDLGTLLNDSLKPL